MATASTTAASYGGRVLLKGEMVYDNQALFVEFSNGFGQPLGAVRVFGGGRIPLEALAMLAVLVKLRPGLFWVFIVSSNPNSPDNGGTPVLVIASTDSPSSETGELNKNAKYIVHYVNGPRIM